MSSIFTKIINKEIPSYTILEDDKFYAFLDIRPMAKGHTLVVPKQETDYIFDLDDITLGEINVFAKRVALALEKAIPCKRIGIMILGMEVPHAHIHLIPINKEADMNLSNSKLILSKEEFEDIRTKIVAQF